jgi:hypothetical protein
MAQAIALPSRPYFRIDNDIIDVYGPKIGAIGVAIYNVLARHADRKTGLCHPCIGTIAQKLKLGRTTVKKYLRMLLNHGLIAISGRLSDKGDPTSNSYRLLDPSPEKVALRRRQLEALMIPQHGTFRLAAAEGSQDGGRSPADPLPCPTATDPRSLADPEQSSSLNKKERTSSARAEAAEKQEALVTEHQQSIIGTRQRTCTHPAEEIVHLSDGLIICNHCYSLLPEMTGILPPLPGRDRAA